MHVYNVCKWLLVFIQLYDLVNQNKHLVHSGLYWKTKTIIRTLALITKLYFVKCTTKAELKTLKTLIWTIAKPTECSYTSDV